MDLLNAVNRILPKLGEHPVTSLDSRSPTLAILLPSIEAKNKEVTGPGWWFNTHKITLFPDPTGEVAVTAAALSFVADCGTACSIRKRRLHNADENTFKWAGPVSGVMVTLVPFDELPESVASKVFYSALVESCVTDIGVTPEAQAWANELIAADSRMLSEHLQHKRYSTRRSPRFSRIRRAMRA